MNINRVVMIRLGVTLFLLALPAQAEAAESRQGPLTLSVGVGSGTFFVDGNNAVGASASQTGVRFPSIDVLYHLDGRSSGLNFGGRQDVWFQSGGAIGLTAARGGYDIPLFVARNRFEITIAPFGLAGIGYGSPGAQFVLGLGADGRFYFKDNFFGYVRPLEILAHIGSTSYQSYDTAIGAGASF
jgi:hypothetical protein